MKTAPIGATELKEFAHPVCVHSRPQQRDSSEFNDRKQLVFFARMLHKRHYVSGTDGNLSLRLDSHRVLITPTGRSKALLKPEHMVVIDMEGRKLEGALEPSSEFGVHLTIYQARHDIKAIVHAHPFAATGFACAGLGLSEPICSELVLTFGQIPIAPYASPGSPELSDALRPFLRGHDAVLLENHGVVAYGTTLERAYLNMEEVEHCSLITLVTRLLGGHRSLSQDEVRQLDAARLRAFSGRCQHANENHGNSELE